MKIGILDIGSNTVKGFVYRVTEDGFSVTAHKSFHTGLMGYVSGGVMTAEGVGLLLRDGSVILDFLMEAGCAHIWAFATSATRDAANRDEIAAEFLSHTGVVLDVIGGEEEALCDYASASFATGRRDGLFLDLGGGSAQIIGADEGGICFSVSLDAGALRMKKSFVAGNLPTREEYAAVKRHVTSVLEQNRIPLLLGGDSMIVMGGTASCLPKLFAAVGREGEILEGQCSISELRLMRDAVFDVGEGMESFLRKAVGDRALVILPGMAVLEGFFSYFSILRIRILTCGSREGYALRKLASLGYFSQFFHS